METAKSSVWISGPGGCGKTTLVADYLDSRKLPCLWYQVDEGESDVATFFYYTGIAARNAFPGHQGPLPVLAAEYLGDVTAFARRWFGMLYSRTKAPFAIVLDNYQEAPNSSLIHKVIRTGISLAPDNVCFVVISRNDPGTEFARLKANRRMGFVGWRDLKFTVEETKEVLRSGGYRDMPQKDLVALHEKTEGWVAGIVLLMESAGKGLINEEVIDAATYDGMFDYYASEVFSKADEGLQQFLMKTAFLPEMSAAVADRLAGVDCAGPVLSDLHKKNYFTERHSDPDPVYRFHPLFRDFLLARAVMTFPHGELVGIQLKAAGLLEEAGRAEDAFILRKAAGDLQGLIRMIHNQAGALIAQGRGKTLEEWLRAIPSEMLEADPRLLYLFGVCRLPFDTCEGRGYFEKAFNGAIKKRDEELGLRAWAGAVETIFLERGDFSGMDPWISWMDHKRVRGLGAMPPGLEIRVVTAMMNAVLSRAPFDRRADEWTNKAQALLGSDIDINDRITLATPLHLYYVYTGDFLNAALIMKRFEHEVARYDLTPFSMIRWSLIEAVNFHMVDPAGEKCLAAVKRGMALSRETGIHVLDIPLLQTGAYGALAAGDMDTMEGLLHEMLPLTKDASYFDRGNYHCIKVVAGLSSGDYECAFEHAEITLQFALKSRSPIPIALAYVGLAQTCIETGQFLKAQAYLTLLTGASSTIRDFKWEFAVLLPKAYLAFRKGKKEKVARLLREAMKSGRERRHFNVLHWCPSMMSLLCAAALDADIETDYVKVLIRKRKLVPDTEIPAPENWPYPLKIYTMGGFDMVIDDRRLDFSGKVQQKPLALLKAIICCSDRDVSQEWLLEALWPDVEGDKASQSFRFTLHQLRKIIGIVDAIRTTGEHLILDRRFVWVDALTFREVADRAILSSGPIDEFKRIADRAISLYKGDFLPGDGRNAWAVAMRERLKGKMLRLIGVAGTKFEKAQRWDDAAGYYRIGLDVDDLQEDIYQRLMRCLYRLGRRADAVAMYRRCCNALAAGLQITPSKETEDIYSLIMSLK
ncbi:MAG TPA: BTAD domain-containing putative transcriptional regulator [Dissulfurispiraceae bacterium]|nr:BTAD domain-containing putative transcriptional regulator [Dissulfurispiraceae bacterium]